MIYRFQCNLQNILTNYFKTLLGVYNLALISFFKYIITIKCVLIKSNCFNFIKYI